MAETNKAIVERINASLAKGDYETFLPIKGKEEIRLATGSSNFCTYSAASLPISESISLQ